MCKINSNKKRIMFSRVSERITVSNFNAHTSLLFLLCSLLLNAHFVIKIHVHMFESPVSALVGFTTSAEASSVVSQFVSMTKHHRRFTCSLFFPLVLNHIGEVYFPFHFGGAGETTGSGTGGGTGACVVTCALMRPSRYHVHAPSTVATL